MGPLDVADPGTMIGRQPELTRLRTLWEDASSGTTRVVLVAGEPGVGKTRLAAELAEIVEMTDGRVLVGRCRQEGATPYEPFVEALAPALAKRSDEWLQTQTQSHGPALARLFPDVAGRLGPDASGEEVGPRTRFLSALAAAITELSRRPVLLVLEDLHWATTSTVLLLTHLARTYESAPLLVLATYRDAAIHPSHPFAGFLDHPPAGGLAPRGRGHPAPPAGPCSGGGVPAAALLCTCPFSLPPGSWGAGAGRVRPAEGERIGGGPRPRALPVA
jgi:predicted ATPase